jgi:predicted RNase H-like HicB family nuclease
MSLVGGAQTGPRLRSFFGTSFEGCSNFSLHTRTQALSAKTLTFLVFAEFFFRPPSTTCTTKSKKQSKESWFLQCGAPIGATGRPSNSRPTRRTGLGAVALWIGEVAEIPGVLTYGVTRDEAVARTKALAFRVLADRLEHGEDIGLAQRRMRSSPG